MERAPRPRTASTPSMPASHARATRYALVRACMARYISPILVDSVLGKAMQGRRLTDVEHSDDLLAAVVEESMVGLRLFVDPRRLPELMVELAEILDKEAP